MRLLKKIYGALSRFGSYIKETVNGCREVVRLIKADLPAFRRTIAESDIMAFLAGVVMFIIFLIGMAFTLRIL